jgi:hypothetical protein
MVEEEALIKICFLGDDELGAIEEKHDRSEIFYHTKCR